MLRNFIQYQAARQTTANFWRNIHRSVIEQLETIEKRNPGDEDEVRKRRKDEIVHFFGYLVRAYVYETSRARKEAS